MKTLEQDHSNNLSTKSENLKQNRFKLLLETTLGPIILKHLHDDKVIEIMLNPDGKLVIDYLGGDKIVTNDIIPISQASRILKLIATHSETIVTSEQPSLAAELPIKKSRFQGWLPPVVSQASFAIRKRAVKIFTLDDYVKNKIITEKIQTNLIAAIKNKKNIIVIGGTGSGKTTFSNALLAEMSKSDDRILILEDLPELQCSSKDHVAMVTTSQVSMRDLVKGSLRMRPDRIIVGEVRDGTALDLLKAWNTGHPGGLCTIHANSAKGGVNRLRDLMLEAVENIPNSLITEAVDILVFIERTKNGSRKIKDIVELTGVKNNEFIFKSIN